MTAPNTPPFEIPRAHRWFAVECNNRAWDLVEAGSRTADETEEMLHAAHAAWLHWKAVGTPLNTLRAEKLLATAYAVAGLGERALWHAERCVELSEQAGDTQTPFDRAGAWGCLSRALGLAVRTDSTRQPAVDMATARAREWASKLEDPQDRSLVEKLFLIRVEPQ